MNNSWSNTKSSKINIITSGVNNILFVILFIIFIVMLFFLFKIASKSSLISHTLLDIPERANKKDIHIIPGNDSIPSLKNGNEYALSFWMYIEHLNTDNDKHKLVLLRNPSGDLTNPLGNSNIIAYIKKNSNSLIIKLRTTEADKQNITISDIDDNITEDVSFQDDNCLYATFKIDYIPLQRWVNIIINVDNNSTTLFFDGEIHSTRITNEEKRECSSDLSRIVSQTKGKFMIGNMSNMPAYNGYISKIQFFNYSLKSPSQVKDIYDSSPIRSNSTLRALGLPLYGIRNPLYRIDGVKTIDDKDIETFLIKKNKSYYLN
jgi:hypothetical protein